MMHGLTRRSILGGDATRVILAQSEIMGGNSRSSNEPYPTSAEVAAASPTVDPVRPLLGRVAFVTGGARGIGRASALELARMGADIVLFDLAQPRGVAGITEYPLASEGDLEEAARLVRETGVRAMPIVGDVRRLADLEAAVARSVSELGGLDVLMVNAGVHHFGDTIGEIDMEAARAMIDVNLYGTIYTLRAAASALRRRPGGRVIITSSIGGRVGMDRALAYQATKWATQGLMKAVALDLAEAGITVNAVAPGPVDSPLHNKEKPIAQVAREDAASTVLPVSIIAPEDIARAVGFLAGPGGTWISGATIEVDAGRVGRNAA